MSNQDKTSLTLFVLRKSPWQRLPFWLRMGLVATALLVPLGGGAVAVVAALPDQPTQRHAAAAVARGTAGFAPPVAAPQASPPSAGLGRRPEPTATAARPTGRPKNRAATPAAPSAPASRLPEKGSAAVRTVTEAIPFRRDTFRDPSLPQGTERIVRSGVPGVRRVTYRVGEDGARRKVIASEVVREPVSEIVAVGSGRGRPDCADDCGAGED
ncbi:G5 domain-containing protein [Spirilliplanes yamanashiensis]|uniref:G5 domain-containing protein n=1 Tax=Spirilliplanes yamanashiensis TaxID=42233 RepID=A0A8J3Y3G9_9ACTN|nr:G5 domain-containing protein [Spirilliplanes yamanashiensis]MDP9814039.1 hypothetical protein [Spirilliplanes yamanashiensis]GIJ00981.1 hypothetical protein Sya03_03330 [Spirilliplanes yamanashiensis]